MANMSYCRMRNTKNDMGDCLEALRNRDISSDEERAAANEMLNDILDFCREEGIIDDYDNIMISEVVDSCQ